MRILTAYVQELTLDGTWSKKNGITAGRVRSAAQGSRRLGNLF
jgi:hypothetical protein